MLVSDVIGTPRSILNDPSAQYWTDAELMSYLNSFMFDACGYRRDLYSIRVASLALAAGVYQTLAPPSGASAAIQLLEVYSANGGPVAFITDMTDLKHSKFASLANATPVSTVQAVSVDPRDRKGYRVYPPSTGTGSNLDALVACIPSPVSNTGGTYPLDPDTVSAAQMFIVGMAFDKNCERRDALKSEQYMARYRAWLTGNLQGQLQEAVQPD